MWDDLWHWIDAKTPDWVASTVVVIGAVAFCAFMIWVFGDQIGSVGGPGR